MQTVLSELSLAGTFSQVVTGEDVLHGKPAPDCYLLAAQGLDLPPADCLVLEDAPNGIAAAKAAGMLCWAVPNEYTRGLDLSAADKVLPSLLAVHDALMQLPARE
jgi:beta-phosphoglucomutase-like phosphatase (HAD superfamily)